MNLFTHDARIFKFEILKEICDEAYAGTLSLENIDAYIEKLIPGNEIRYRNSLEQEREIVRQYARLAMGKNANNLSEEQLSKRQIVQVIQSACDACTLQKVRVTDNCRKCMAKSCMASCAFGAVHMGEHRAEIDVDKCKQCGACSRACSYSAIVITQRPCYAACPVGAMTYDENKIAKIDEKKCLNCGRCLASCPFGAIQDRSQLVEVIEALKKGERIAAIYAPSIQGQYGRSTLAQIKQGFYELGFSPVREVALAADVVAYVERKELLEHKEKGIPMTTSCCPGFVNMAKIHFPDIYLNNMSSAYSPMMAMGEMMKAKDPSLKIVFIGPCTAKKQEVQEEFSTVDYCLTYEEYEAMLISRQIHLPDLKSEDDEEASVYGRNFAQGSGVSAAVAQMNNEENGPSITAVYADGGHECKKQLMIMKAGRFNGDILEGMCCPGGCIGGPVTVEDANVVRNRMNKENSSDTKTITESLQDLAFADLTMERPKNL